MICKHCKQAIKTDFWNSKECQGIVNLLPRGVCLTLLSIQTPNGTVCAFSVMGDEFGNDLVEVTDENLLAKLRDIKGQYVWDRYPVFWYEHLMSTIEFTV